MCKYFRIAVRSDINTLVNEVSCSQGEKNVLISESSTWEAKLQEITEKGLVSFEAMPDSGIRSTVWSHSIMLIQPALLLPLH